MLRRDVLFLMTASLAAAPLPVPAAEGWPRVFANDDGTSTEIAAPPERILSGSVTLTGTLLAIGAPVVASGATPHGGYFSQWQEVAAARGVEPLWPAGAVDLEAAWAIAPDLIVIASSGADSALAQRAQLEAVAPVVVLDYSDQPWQEVTRKLGVATGTEAGAEATLQSFAEELAATRDAIEVPPGGANIVSYNGRGAPNPISTPDSPQAQLLAALGFEIEAPDPAWAGPGGMIGHYVRAEYEHLTGLQAGTTFLLAAGPERAAEFLGDPLLAALPSVKAGRVTGLGPTSFRIDPYSARDVLAVVRDAYGRDR
ncbi:Fe2+-enterobactin ABC transporter substrate-binding protein [Poseidonocella sp. HB161398]|uniref:Fe2+-enterobactin ABC transporter substrate-binding protein n=1 Tax=Poseidonocella sp. HB161398 TaxID=2320855 RepID=UPI0011086600|nr:Fe2+-enterobactin ABC transporter substrate-binding protein [Poseidonocella sp. HB161398]